MTMKGRMQEKRSADEQTKLCADAKQTADPSPCLTFPVTLPGRNA